MLASETLEFRTYQPKDLEQVLALERNAFADQELYAKLVMNLEDLYDIPANYIDRRGDFLVGVQDEKIVAMGGLRQKSEDIVHIGRMRTKLELQGRGLGIGRRMLALLEARAVELGYTSVTLSTSAEQTIARRLYESSGYDVTHFEPYRVLEIHYSKQL